MNVKSRSTKLDWKKLAIVAVVIAIAGYKWYTDNQQAQPELAGAASQSTRSPDEYKINFPGADAPAAKQSKNGADPSGRITAATSRYLKPAGGKNLKSPAGLIYNMSRSGEHRADHVLRHAEDQPNRNGSHGVFDANGDDVFRLVDEAYDLVKAKSQQVKISNSDGKLECVIDMQRRIGYKGGQSGKRAGNPPLSKMKLILGDNRVITAYPY